MNYPLAARILHWFIALLIIALLIVGDYMSEMPVSPLKWEIYGIHKATGVVVLFFVALRIFYRLSHKYPDLPNGTPKFNAILAKSNYLLLYILMLIMPLSGMFGSLLAGYDVSVFDLFTIHAFEKNAAISEIMWQIHGAGFNLFAIAIGAHIAGSIYHQFIIKDNLLRRMILGR